MTRRAFPPFLLLLAFSARAEPVPGAFHGLALSLGAGLPVCAKVTFDRAVAEAGGRILVLDAASASDDAAIRMSEAVVVRRGGLSSRAGASARRHGVPAVALGQGRWDGRGPTLYLDEPSYGNPASAAGVDYRPVIGSEERALREGDALIVDPASGRVVLVPPSEADARVAAAEAARAYDGLRDAGALEVWLAQSDGSRRGAALLEELVPRAVAGSMTADDLSRVRRAAERFVPASSREEMRRAEARVFARAAREAKRRAEDCGMDADEAGAAVAGVSAVARLLSLNDGGAVRAARQCLEAARRRGTSRGDRQGFAQAAASGGADRPEGVELPARAWEDFVEGNGLSEWLTRTLDDSSLGLRRKSERIRERILAGRLGPVTEVTGAVMIVGDDAALKADGPADAPQRIKEVWAASWTPGPLGARQRAGRGRAYDGRVRVEKIVPADVSGLAFSRDPGSGRRERVFVEAAPGPLEGILSGDAAAQSYALDRGSGREVAPRSGGAAAALSPARLARVARLARALDAWKGAGVEIAFSFAGERLIAHHARALEPPRPVLPLNDPFAPRPEAGYLNIKPVAR